MVNYWFHAYRPENFEQAKSNGFGDVWFESDPKKIRNIESIRTGDYVICYLAKYCKFWGVLEVMTKPEKTDGRFHAKTKGVVILDDPKVNGIYYKEMLKSVSMRSEKRNASGGTDLGVFVQSAPLSLQNGEEIVELIKKKASRVV